MYLICWKLPSKVVQQIISVLNLFLFILHSHCVQSCRLYLVFKCSKTSLLLSIASLMSELKSVFSAQLEPFFAALSNSSSWWHNWGHYAAQIATLNILPSLPSLHWCNEVHCSQVQCRLLQLHCLVTVCSAMYQYMYVILCCIAWLLHKCCSVHRARWWTPCLLCKAALQWSMRQFSVKCDIVQFRQLHIESR